MTRTHTAAEQDRPSLSLELFPPRPGPHSSQTWGALDRLLRARPDFVSVTYRPRFVTTAGGPRAAAIGSALGSEPVPRPTRVHVIEEHNPSEDVLAHVLDRSTVPLMAHLTCIGYRKRDAVEIVRRFLDMGVRRFLALRGDPPPGVHPSDVVGELRRAEDLVRVIREVEAEYFDDDAHHLEIAVAAYPAEVDHGLGVEILAAKEAAGADLAISQVFYRAEDYLSLARSCLYSGVSMPIVAGIIPLTDLRRLTRLESLTGVAVPGELREALSHDGTVGTGPVTRGIDATLNLATKVLDGGAPGLHLYTFNRTRPALDVISQLRLGGILSGSVPSRKAQREVSRDYLNASPGGDRRARPGPGWPGAVPGHDPAPPGTRAGPDHRPDD